MKMTATEVRVTFSLEEAAAFCRIEPQAIRNWITKRLIEPAVRGGKGRGKAHRFTPQQVIGLMTVVGLRCSTRGCNAPYFMETYKRHSDWTWSATEQFLGLRDDAWSQEAFAKAVPKIAAPLPDDDMHPDDVRVMIEYGESLIRLRLELQRAVKEHPVYSKKRMGN